MNGERLLAEDDEQRGPHSGGLRFRPIRLGNHEKVRACRDRRGKGGPGRPESRPVEILQRGDGETVSEHSLDRLAPGLDRAVEDGDRVRRFWSRE
jgi:hypothetical protein